MKEVLIASGPQIERGARRIWRNSNVLQPPTLLLNSIGEISRENLEKYSEIEFGINLSTNRDMVWKNQATCPRPCGGEITQVRDAMPWVRCASDNV